MKSKLLNIAGIIVLVAFTALTSRQVDTSQPPPPSAQSPDSNLPRQTSRTITETHSGDLLTAVNDLRSELHRLNADMANLRRQVAELQSRPSASAAIEIDKTASAKETAVALTEARQQRQQLLDATASAFGQEIVDTDWSVATTARLHEALGHGTDSGALIRAVECRSTTCRVELVDDGSGKFNEMFAMATLKLADILPNALVQPADETMGGTPSSIVYLSRMHSPSVNDSFVPRDVE